MSGRFRFGDFELDVAAYTLSRTDQRIKIEKMPMEVLILLVRRQGILLSRSEVQAALWGADVFVDQEAAINTAIRKIRRALGDDAEHPRFVETVVGKGYRFVAPVATEDGDADVAARRGAAASPANSKQEQTPVWLLRRGKQDFVLDNGENLLGRDPDASVHLDHPSVSRRHARISVDANAAVLEDLKSRNGTFVDGQRIDAPTPIHDGAIVALGPITLVVVFLPPGASTLPIGDNSDPTRGPQT